MCTGNGVSFWNSTPSRKTNVAGGLCNNMDSKPSTWNTFAPASPTYLATTTSLSLLCREWSNTQIISGQGLFVGGNFLLMNRLYIYSTWSPTGQPIFDTAHIWRLWWLRLIFCPTLTSVWGHYLAERSIYRQILTSWQRFWAKIPWPLAGFRTPSVFTRALELTAPKHQWSTIIFYCGCQMIVLTFSSLFSPEMDSRLQEMLKPLWLFLPHEILCVQPHIWSKATSELIFSKDGGDPFLR